MNRITGIALIALGLLLAAAPMARAGGLDVIGYGDDCWGTGTDADSDGLNDGCEDSLAYWFMPQMWFDSGESGYDRRPYYAVKSKSFSARTVQVFYMNTYFEDSGILSGHDGDAEFQVFEMHYSAGKWFVDWVYMSSHRKTGCDGSTWYRYDQLEYDTSDASNAYRGWPTIYVAEDKHASYNNLNNCEKGCFYQDHCSRYRNQYLDQWSWLSGRNVGSTVVKLINEVTLNSTLEHMMDNVEFTGWDDESGRPNSGGYRRHLDDFSF